MNDQSNGKSTKLDRELNFWDTLMFGVGGMLGAGIYAIIGEATADAGNLLWVSLTIAALVAVITSFTYAELVSMFPDAGGGYEYIAQAFGRTFAAFAGILLLLTGIVAAAAIAIAFADYFTRLFDWPDRLVVIGVLALVTGFNVWGAGESSWFNIIATIVTILGLVGVIIVGAMHWGEADLLAPAPGGTVGVMSGAALAFFSYVGFEDTVKLAEETKNPRKTVSWAIVLSSLIVMVFYLLVAAAAVTALNHERLAEAPGPLAAVMEQTWGRAGAITITVIALFATSKTVLTNIMGNSRVTMDIAREHRKLSWLAYVAPRLRTPVVALGLVFLVTLAFAMIGDLGVVASISNLCIFLAYITVNAALIKVRLSRPELDAQFRVPLSIGRVPVLPCVSILLLAVLIVANVPNLLGG